MMENISKTFLSHCVFCDALMTPENAQTKVIQLIRNILHSIRPCAEYEDWEYIAAKYEDWEFIAAFTLRTLQSSSW